MIFLKLDLETLLLRRTLAEDAAMIWEARQSSTSVPIFRTIGLGDYDDHVRWIERAVSDPGILFFTAALAEQPVGYVRFNRLEQPGCYRTSIGLLDCMRGSGLGKVVLEKGCHCAFKLSAETLVAEIHSGNAASQRIFVACGFVHDPGVQSEDGFDSYVRLRETQ